MKLRNKKTGEVINIDFMYPETAEYFHREYKLRDFIREWEDYAPKEPLIKDEKTRKLVKDWALINGIHAVFYDSSKTLLGTERCFMHIVITRLRRENLEDACIYTIGELCGDEE